MDDNFIFLHIYIYTYSFSPCEYIIYICIILYTQYILYQFLPQISNLKVFLECFCFKCLSSNPMALNLQPTDFSASHHAKRTCPPLDKGARKNLPQVASISPTLRRSSLDAPKAPRWPSEVMLYPGQAAGGGQVYIVMANKWTYSFSYNHGSGKWLYLKGIY